MTRFGVHLAAWQRHRLLGIVLDNLQRCKRELADEGVEIIVSVAVSNADDPGARDAVVPRADIVVDIANDSLGGKVNAAVRALGDLDCDALVGIGSDDLVTPQLFRVYAKLLAYYDMIAMPDVYCYDVVTHRLVYWAGYGLAPGSDKVRTGEPIGVGRCVSRAVLDKMHWQLFRHEDVRRNLDGGMMIRLQERYGETLAKLHRCIVPSIAINAPVTDVKTALCLNPMPQGVEVELADAVLAAWYGDEIASAVLEL